MYTFQIEQVIKSRVWVLVKFGSKVVWSGKFNTIERARREVELISDMLSGGLRLEKVV